MAPSASLKQWELENNIIKVSSTANALYTLPPLAPYKQLTETQKPWKDDPHYFTGIRISALALLKMTMHARSGGSIEIMGLMVGYVSGREFIITDAYRLPVEATETRVNAHEQAYEYMATFADLSRQADRQENPIGWYHSHPGYGCWLSGIDVSTQRTWQQGNTPFVAVVIDPDRTVSAGKVEIGAFRAYETGQRPSQKRNEDDGFQAIPTGKIEDFGAHANDYYSLEVNHFKSSLDQLLIDQLWQKYWTATLAQAPLFTNQDYLLGQIGDQAVKTNRLAKGIVGSGSGGQAGPRRTGASDLSMSEDGKSGFRVVPDKGMEQIVKSGNKVGSEAMVGLLANSVKEQLFVGVVREARVKAASAQAIEVAAGSAVGANAQAV